MESSSHHISKGPDTGLSFLAQTLQTHLCPSRLSEETPSPRVTEQLVCAAPEELVSWGPFSIHPISMLHGLSL